MPRTSTNQYSANDQLVNGYDYENQAWVKDGRYQDCGHQKSTSCNCYGRRHAGETVPDLIGRELLDRPCRREDICAVIPQWNRWLIDSNGDLSGQYIAGDLDGCYGDIDEFVCNNCGLYFTPEKTETGGYVTFTNPGIEIAWGRALAHLPSVKTSTGRLVSREGK